MSPIYGLLNEGLALHARGEPFEAHERFEDAWRATEGAEKSTLQALVQICAAAVKGAQGNLRGTGKLLDKAERRLAGGPRSCLGLDLVDLLDRVRGARAAALEGRHEIVPLPARAAERGVLYLHGFASGPSSAKAQRIVPALREDGLEVRLPDLNEGGFEHLTVTRILESAERRLFDRTLVIGSSLGGYAACLLAVRDPRVKALVLMAPAFDFAARLEGRHGPEVLEAWRRDGVTEVEHHAYGGLHRVGYALYEDARRHPARPVPRVPTYILQGERDDVVPADVVRAAAAEMPDVTLEVVDDEHGLVDSADRPLAAARRLAAALE